MVTNVEQECFLIYCLILLLFAKVFDIKTVSFDKFVIKVVKMVHLFMELKLTGFCLLVCFELLLKSEFVLVNRSCVNDGDCWRFFY